jgi:glycine/sarcosine N-methyltransferase
VTIFDDFSDAYDLMFPWETRRKGEGAFFADLFRERGIRSVLDCACGTGMHLVDFARLGLAAYGSDLSPHMVEKAMESVLREGLFANVRAASFTELTRRFDPDERFDAIVCVGNSLTLAPTDADVATAVREMHEVLNPGGSCVIGLFNWDLLAKTGLRIMPASLAVQDGREVTFLRVFHHRGDRIDLNIVVIGRKNGEAETRVLTAHQRPVGPERILRFVRDAGFASCETFSGYDRKPFDRESSDNLLVVARKD